jgi:4-aminobutyrate aminotransferase/(S)-3-amino-2-methylpropionate transaminase
LETHALANSAEEERCLAEVDRLMADGKARGRDVAALVVEPVQAEGGDNHASHGFFLVLRRLCTRHGAFFIVDEVTDGRPSLTLSLTLIPSRDPSPSPSPNPNPNQVQTGGGASGKFWAHEHWQLPAGEEPDFVTFSKKLQTGGYFHKVCTATPRLQP